MKTMKKIIEKNKNEINNINEDEEKIFTNKFFKNMKSNRFN